MENRLELSGQAWQEIEPAELANIRGGFVLLFLAVPTALRSVYELGSATGREVYHWQND